MNVTDVVNKAESEQKSEVKAQKANKIGLFFSCFYYFGMLFCLRTLSPNA